LPGQIPGLNFTHALQRVGKQVRITFHRSFSPGAGEEVELTTSARHRPTIAKGCAWCHGDSWLSLRLAGGWAGRFAQHPGVCR
jgi:hypothetical protein